MDAFNLIQATCTKINISLLFVTAFAHSQMCLQLPFQSSRFCLLFPILQEQDFHYKEACRLKPHTLVDYLGFLVPVVNYPKKDEKQKQTNKQTTWKPLHGVLPLFIITTLYLWLGKTFYFIFLRNTFGSFYSLYGISIGNSMICSDIWHIYHEWYFEIVVRNFTSR